MLDRDPVLPGICGMGRGSRRAFQKGESIESCDVHFGDSNVNFLCPQNIEPFYPIESRQDAIRFVAQESHQCR